MIPRKANGNRHRCKQNTTRVKEYDCVHSYCWPFIGVSWQPKEEHLNPTVCVALTQPQSQALASSAEITFPLDPHPGGALVPRAVLGVTDSLPGTTGSRDIRKNN